MKKRFTLIELLAVIMVLAALASIVYARVVNVKNEAIRSAIQNNTGALQLAVDKYMLDNPNQTPTKLNPYLGDPQLIEYDALYPKYIKKKPDLSVAKYWVDYEGKVWGSTTDGPDKVYDREEFFSWEDNTEGEEEVEYKVFEHVDNKSVSMLDKVGSMLSKVAGVSAPYRELRDAEIERNGDIYKVAKKQNTHYYIQAFDYLGLPTPLFNPNYQGYPIKDDFGNFLPFVKGGTYYFTTNAKEPARWLSFEKSDSVPEGTKINYEFATSEDGKNFTGYTKDFNSLPDSQYVKVKVTLVPSATGKTPTLLRLKVHFKTLRELGLSGGQLSNEAIDQNTYSFDGIIMYDQYAGQFVAPTPNYPNVGSVSPSKPPEKDPIFNYYEYETGSNYYTLSKNQTFGTFSKVFSTGGQIRSFSDLIANTDIPKGSTIRYTYQSSVDGINFTNTYDNIEDVPPGTYLKVNVEMTRPDTNSVPPSISDLIVTFEEPKAEEPSQQDEEGEQWITLQKLYYVVDAEKVGDWISADIYDEQPEGTRIVYTYSTSSDGSTWANHNTDISKVPNSRYLNVEIALQVNPTSKKQPTFYEIMVNYKVDDQEKKDIYLGNNRDMLQQAVDKYYAANNEYPAFEQPVIYVPDTINFSKLYPTYLNMRFEADGAFYWVDYLGKVWASTVDSPKNIASINRIFTWDAVEGASFYKIYAEEDGKFVFKKNIYETKYNISDSNEKYFVSAVDKYGNPSAPVGVGYQGYTGNCNEYGKGTADDPFVVCSVETFDKIRNDMYAHYILTRNLDFTEVTNFNPLGHTGIRFYGSFDGQGYTIENITINRGTNGYTGIFADVNSTATIKNLNVDNAKVTGGSYTAVLAGRNYGTIENVNVQGEVNASSSYSGGITGYSYGPLKNISSRVNIVSTSSYVGGIAGNGSNLTENVYSYGSIKGSSYVGGLFGQHTHLIRKSFSISHVDGQSTTGGLVGHKSSGSIENAYHIGSVTGKTDIGGFVGINSSSTNKFVYSRTRVNGDTNVGGLVGRTSGGSFTNAYWDGYYSTQNRGVQGQASNVNAMTKQSHYTDWDFNSIWKIDEGTSLPYLQGMPKLKEVIAANMPSDYEAFSSGKGTIEDPYIITSEVQLDNVRYELNAHYKLGKDITLTKYQEGSGWSPIGTLELPFNGSLDGDGYSIRNLYINRSTNETGLFGYTGSNSKIENIKVEGANVTGNSYSGILVGRSNSIIKNAEVVGKVTGTSYTGGLIGMSHQPVENSKATVDLTSNNNYVGGLIGYQYSSTINSSANGKVVGNQYVGGLIGRENSLIEKSYSTAIVNGNQYVGGLVGASYGPIKQSYSIGSVEGTNSTTYAGGLTGYQNGNYIENSFTLSDVKGNNYVGGLSGQTDNTQIRYSYAKQKMTAQDNGVNGQTGGLIGYQSNSSVTNSYWDSHSSGFVTTASRFGTALNTSSMFNQEQFINWDFINTWEMNGSIPYLKGLPQPDKTKKDNISYTFEGFEGGIGTSSNPYQIKTETQLANVQYQLDSHYVVLNDITLENHQADKGWTPIGTQYKEFIGSFDGKNNTVSNLYSNRTENYVGLFGYANGNFIKNLTLKNVNITGQHYTAGLIGYSNADLEKIQVSGTVNGKTFNNVGGVAGYVTRPVKNSSFVGSVSGHTYIGGLVGYIQTTITDSFSKGDVKGNSYVGGLAGRSHSSISKSYSWSDVQGGNRTGGLTGYSTANIDTVYATGNVEGTTEVGGLIGFKDSGYINHAFATGTVKGTSTVAGLVGQLTNSSVRYTYAIKEVSGTSNVFGLISQSLNSSTNDSYWDSYSTKQLKSQGGVGSNTQSMLKQQRYSNWDFTNKWTIEELDTTPYLKELAKPVEVNKENINSDFEYFSGGKGTLEDPYLIENQNQLNNVRYELDAHYRLISDIDLTDYQTGEGWLPIADTQTPFLGSFDGNNYTIENLFIDRNSSYNGLFGVTNSGTKIYDLTLKNVKVDGGSYTGGLVGSNRSKVDNISISGEVVGSHRTGGLFGNNNGQTDKVTSTANVTGNSSYIGGIVGYNTAPLSDIHVDASIKNSSSYTGGIAGFSSQRISNSDVKGEVLSRDYTGGMAGQMSNSIHNSYVLATVSGQSYVGGFNGSSTSYIEKSYYDGDVTGTNDYIGGLVGQLSGSGLENTFALGTVKGNRYVGGLIGESSSSSIVKSYARNKVDGVSIGGLVGNRTGSSNAPDSYWDSAYTDYWKSEVNLNGGINSQIYSMIQQRRYNNWDFQSIWTIEEGKTIPYLQGLPIPEKVHFDKLEKGMVSFEGGTGEETNPYLIKTAEQLNNIRWEMDSHYKIVDDIDLSTYQTTLYSTDKGTGFEPIGDNHTPFRGVLDGQNHTISNFKTITTEDYVGLFGETSSAVVIKNITLENVDVKGRHFTAGLVGNNYGKIENITISGKVDGNLNTGGLLGWSNNSVSLVESDVDVLGVGTVGGLIGYSSAEINETYAIGDVQSSGTGVGGLVGRQYTGSINNSFALGKVNGATEVGGLVGRLEGKVDNNNVPTVIVTVTNSYAKNPEVTGLTYDVGGLIGTEVASKTTNSYWDYYSSKRIASRGGEGMSTIYFFKQERFKEWDFNSTWVMTENETIPYLRNLITPEEIERENIFIDFLGFENGDGTAENPYQIKTEQQMAHVQYGVEQHYVLLNDIELEQYKDGVGPIANYYEPFNGSFDGQNFTVSNAQINKSADYTALFGRISSKGSVKNLKLSNLTVSGQNFTAGLVGYLDGQITNIHVQGSISGYGYVGGIIGRNNANITDVHSEVSISARDGYSGGIAGRSYSPIENATSIVSFSTQSGWAGGIVGETSNTLKNVESTVTMSTTSSHLGGIVGKTTSTITDAIVKGSITGTGTNNHIGGIVGESNGSITNAQSDVTITFTTNTGSYIGGIAGRVNAGVFNSTAVGDITSNGSYVGGLAGYVSSGVTDSSATGNVTGNQYVGGLTGSSSGIISKSFATGNVTGSGSYVGGLSGYHQSNITDSYATGNVSSSGSYVGGLSGRVNGTTDSSYYTGEFVKGHNYTGGLVGYTAANVSNSYSNTKVDGNEYVGGLVGKTEGGNIDKSYVFGDTSGNRYVGGIVGHQYKYTQHYYQYCAYQYSWGCSDWRGYWVEDTHIAYNTTNSFVKGNVTGNSYVGGIAGYIDRTRLQDNYFVGSVQGSSNTYSIVGYDTRSSVESNNYYNKDLSNLSGNGGTGRTTEVMKRQYGYYGFDFTNIWAIEEGVSYPYLKNSENPYEGEIEQFYIDNPEGPVLTPVEDLIVFQTATFTNAGATGRTGPSQSQIEVAYAGSDLEGNVVSNNGIQNWGVPKTGQYRIEAYGASGGTYTYGSHTAGKGAIMKGTFTLSANDQLKILVGQQGGSYGYTGGGGGGTFVTTNANSPLIIAGGGGGAGNSGGNGFNASTGQCGTQGHPNYGYGCNGYSSNNSNNNGWGQGGAGLLGDGSGWQNYSYSNGAVAKSFINGGVGAAGNINGSTSNSCSGAWGGFGGGGSGACNGAGGGGGYSGGGQGGGGAGSYNNGTNPSNSVSNTGHGKVIITYLGE